jgi:surface antigen
MGITQQNLFLDPITDKTKYVNSQQPKAGSVMIMDSQTSPQYGHVAVVESVNNDGTVNLKEANWNGDGKIHTRKNVDPSKM